MQIEINQLDLRYASLRIIEPRQQSNLTASLHSEGQQVEVLTVAGGAGQSYILIDGYRRVAALQSLGRDTVEAVVLPVNEITGLVLCHRLSESRRRSILEEGWLLHEMVTVHGKSQSELSVLLHRSRSWISRRLSLVRLLPQSVQETVRKGRMPPQAAMKYLVPLARANKGQCRDLVTNLGRGGISVRQMHRIYLCWKKSAPEKRISLVANPRLYLKILDEADLKAEVGGGDDRVKNDLMKDLEILIAVSRRVRRRVAGGVLRESGTQWRASVRGLWHESRFIFGSLVQLLEKEFSDEKLRDTDCGSGVDGAGARQASDRENTEDIPRRRQANTG